MKYSHLFNLFLCLAATVALAQEPPPQRPIVQTTFRVVTDSDDPVHNATILMSTFHHWEAGEGFGKDATKTVMGNTDQDGRVTLSLPSLRGEIAYRVRDAEAFYRDHGMERQFKEHAEGKWQPVNPEVKVVFKPVLNPIAMFAKSLATHIPRSGEKFGYDVIAGDWVAPHRNGKVADLLFELTGNWRAPDNYDSALVVTFSNPADGVQPFATSPPHKGSVFRSPRNAPEANYVDRLELRRTRNPEQDSAGWIDEASDSRNYFFRVRTVIDGKGKVVSALYGKINDGFKFAGASAEGSFLKFIYCANPTANDRNLEFDPTRNLFGNLPASQQVREP